MQFNLTWKQLYNLTVYDNINSIHDLGCTKLIKTMIVLMRTIETT